MAKLRRKVGKFPKGTEVIVKKIPGSVRRVYTKDSNEFVASYDDPYENQAFYKDIEESSVNSLGNSPKGPLRRESRASRLLTSYSLLELAKKYSSSGTPAQKQVAQGIAYAASRFPTSLWSQADKQPALFDQLVAEVESSALSPAQAFISDRLKEIVKGN